MDRNDALSRRPEKQPSSSFFYALVAGIVLVAGALWWWVFPSLGPAEPEPAVASQRSPATPEVEPTPSPSTREKPATVAAQATPPAEPSQQTEAEQELRRPHPITPEHQRIFRENNLIGALDGAMDVGDYEAMRRMNAEYKRDYPEDANVLQEGYDLIADCLEGNTPETRARAQTFWRTKKSSQLRRYVRRHCLQGKAPGSG